MGSFASHFCTVRTDDRQFRRRWAAPHLLLGSVRRGVSLLVYILVLHLALHVALIAIPDAAARQLGWFAIDRDFNLRIQERLGIVGSPTDRYLAHLGRLLRGDLGVSLRGGFPVANLIAGRIAVSFPLWTVTSILIVLIPAPLAAIYASPRDRPILRGFRAASSVGLLPQFIVAVLLFVLFDRGLRPLLPPRFHPGLRLFLASLSVSTIPGLVIFTTAADLYEHEAKAPWVTVARAFGHGWIRIRLMMSANVLILLRTVYSRVVLYTLIGTAFTEIIFSISGIGAAFVEALTGGDVPVVFGIVLLFGAATHLAQFTERS